MEENKSKLGMEKRALTQVQTDEKQNWWAIAFIWIGVMISIPTLMVGATLSNYFEVGTIVAIALIGYVIVSLLMGFTGCLGSDLSRPTAVVGAKGFGEVGTRIIVSGLGAVTTTGWFGIQTATCAAAFNGVLELVGVSFPFWASCIIWGAVMFITAVFGFSWMKWLNYIAVPALVIVCIYGVVVVAKQGGIAAPSMAGQMTLTAAISMTVATMISGALIASDFSRYAKSKRDSFLSSLCGVLPAGMLMFFVGAFISGSRGGEDLVAVFTSLGMPFLALAVLILATWTTNTGNVYVAGLALTKMFAAKDSLRPLITGIAGAVGTALAVAGILDAFTSVLTLLGGLVPSAVAVMVSDYWLVGKGHKENWFIVKGFNWLGVIAWAVGCVVALRFSFFASAIDGFVVSLLLYFVIAKIFGGRVLKRSSEPGDVNAGADAKEQA
jgi:cytosine permease